MWLLRFRAGCPCPGRPQRHLPATAAPAAHPASRGPSRPTPPHADPVGESEHEGEKGASQRSQRGGGASVAANGHVGSDVAIHVGSQRWSEAFWTSNDTLE